MKIMVAASKGQIHQAIVGDTAYYWDADAAGFAKQFIATKGKPAGFSQQVLAKGSDFTTSVFSRERTLFLVDEAKSDGQATFKITTIKLH